MDAARATALPISLRAVGKTYGPVCALAGVDLDVRAGEFLSLLGPSGSGKTTLLMILAGFIRPDGGSVKFGGEEMILTPPHKRNIGMVFQNYALFPHMDVAANIGYPLALRGVPAKAAAERVRRALAVVRLEGLGGRRVHQLSGGQKQRVALARAIVFNPRILLMDEPLSALDKKLREQMQMELRQLHEQLGMTTVYVTHDQREALTMSDRIAVINEGRLIQLDTPRRVYDRPADMFVADFVGESTLLPVRVADGAIRRGKLKIDAADGLPSDGDYLLLLRPERVTFAEGGGAGDSSFAGVVKSATYQGESVLVRVKLEDGAEVLVRGAAAPRPGAAVRLRVRREHIVLIPPP